jgi:hypothetical protein
MTTTLDIANRALQVMGSRTNMSAAEFAGNTSNEAIQANLVILKLRDELNRMAPWDCVQKFAPLTYITSTPTTPENQGPGPPLWQAGLPAPPWAYEYQYPVDCLRAIKIIPQYTALSGGVPIYPPGVSTGFNSSVWSGPVLKFKISTDSFYGVTAASVAAGGSGYAVGDIITLTQPTFTAVQLGVSYTMSVGAPARLQVVTAPAGVVATVSVVNQIQGETDGGGTPIGGSYFAPVSSPVGQGSTTGVGTGATFNLTFGAAQAQRVILCNQESAILCYNGQVTDPNVMDPLFQDAWIHILGARLCFQLSGDKALANQLVGLTNNMIMEARKVDGNEGITINDITPDFMRIRGNWGGPNWEYSPNMSFDWGSFYSPY